jgi:hypothetical protein
MRDQSPTTDLSTDWTATAPSAAVAMSDHRPPDLSTDWTVTAPSAVAMSYERSPTTEQTTEQTVRFFHRFSAVVFFCHCFFCLFSSVFFLPLFFPFFRRRCFHLLPALVVVVVGITPKNVL